MKEFRVEVRVKNNLLYSAIEAAGFDSVAAFSRSCGVSQTTVGSYINMSLPPLKGNVWRQSAVKVADALKALPEDLFPTDYLQVAIEQNKVVREYSAAEITGIMQVAQETPETLLLQQDAVSRLETAINGLKPRHQEAIKRRFGLDGHQPHTLPELGAVLNVSVSRAQAIELSALRALKQPSKKLTRDMLTYVSN